MAEHIRGVSDAAGIAFWNYVLSMVTVGYTPMSNHIGAPGRGISRREFLAATGGAGVLSLAGCSAPTNNAPGGARPQVASGGLPTTNPPTRSTS